LSKNREFSSTSANRYSLALYELASETKLLNEIQDDSFNFIKLISNSKEFDNLIKNPTLSQDVLFNVINKVSEISNLESLFKNFLGLLISKRRFFYVERILKIFLEICSEKRGELKAEIKSAKQLSNDEIEKITQDLSNNFNSKVKLNYKYDQSLIGGLVVQVGSIMIDTSIKSKLQQIKTKMIEA
tara:strand:+ start:156 stop:713 length:558 start_codon:yes stop_codon:yes gene_type:complete